MNKNKVIKKIITKLGTASLALAIATTSTGALAPIETYALQPTTPVIVAEQMIKRSIVFTDVGEGWEKVPVYWAVDRGVVQGYEDGTFRPNNQMTEAEWATMLVRYASNIDYDKLNKLDNQHWSQHLYNELSKFKLPFKGYSDNKVKDQPITRGDIAIIVAAKNGFNLTLEQAVEYMYENDLSEGMGSVKDFENYGAHLYLTRAQATAFLKRINEKGVTTFRGVESTVKPDEIKGIEKPVYDGTKEGKFDTKFNKIAEDIANKHGYVVAKGSTGVQIRDKNNKTLVLYGTSAGTIYTSNTQYSNMLYEMIEQIENYSKTDMDKIKTAITESSKTNDRVFIEEGDKTIQIQVSYKGDISIHIKNY